MTPTWLGWLRSEGPDIAFWRYKYSFSIKFSVKSSDQILYKYLLRSVRHFLLNTVNFLFSLLLGNLSTGSAYWPYQKQNVAKLAVVSRRCDLIPMTGDD